MTLNGHFMVRHYCLFGRGTHCDQMVHFQVDLAYSCIVQCSGHPDSKACPPTPNRLFSVSPGKAGTEVGYGCAK